MSFLANQSPPTAAAEPRIENDGWFPDVKPDLVRAQARLDGTVTVERLERRVKDAAAPQEPCYRAYPAPWAAQDLRQGLGQPLRP